MKLQRWLFLIAFLLALTALSIRLYGWLIEGEEQDWLELLLPGFFTLFCLYGMIANPEGSKNG
ncbi:MAG: hypothetical protein ACT4OE_09640 [Sphingosinicella sp.]